MSVLIKGMEMPKEGTVIAIYKLKGKHYASVHGTELCPLVSVPPHGRLIDADALKIMMPTIGDEYLYAREMIEEAPTIIEAEEEQE